MSSQKVVIPKWMINPEEVTVIEIPAELKSIDTVIIKPKLFGNANYNYNAESAEPNLLQLPKENSEKLDATINIPQWNEYFAQAIKRRAADREELYANEMSDDEEDDEEQHEEIDDDREEYLESGVELTESEILMNYEGVPDLEMEHGPNLQEANNGYEEITPRHMLMKSPYSSVNKVVRNVFVTPGNKVEHVEDLLELVEKFEYSKIHRDLKDFQKARRKLIFSTTKLSTTPCFTMAPE